MRKMMTLVLGVLCAVALTVYAVAAQNSKSHTYKKSCDEKCAMRAGGRQAPKYQLCMNSCEGRRN